MGASVILSTIRRGFPQSSYESQAHPRSLLNTTLTNWVAHYSLYRWGSDEKLLSPVLASTRKTAPRRTWKCCL